ncbi:hypothetical protein ES703_50914 [subsurface metagenome]
MMVKIVNELGEVKTGVQGEAVYQGRYGQQIRRTRQPKRAIPSQKQLEHRQLYREALTWRKALSLPNRRYLDGYCIANWIVDDYKIALPWSRFALKLYLQHIGFVMVEKATLVLFGAPEELIEEQLLQNYERPLGVDKETRVGQRLTIPNRKVIKLAFVMKKLYATTGTVTFTIRKVSDDSLIVSKLWGNLADIPIPYTMLEVEFDDPQIINEEVRILAEEADSTAGKYAGIGVQSVDVKPDEFQCQTPPASYEELPGRDCTYRYTYILPNGEEGEIDWSKSQKGLLHVRHPALLSGEHRRDGKLLESWTNLSNLDEEYITGQVGVDVFPGDELKFATIAGVEYAFRVP